MIKIRKILFSSTSIVLSLTTFSCSAIEAKPHEPCVENYDSERSQKLEVLEKVRAIADKAKYNLSKLSTTSVLSVPTTVDNYNKINEKNTLKYNDDQWKHKFFDHVTEPLYHNINSNINSKVIKISNKDEFNNIVVKRYQELNSFEGYEPKSDEVISTFEKTFLNNNKVSNLLEANDIYILHANNRLDYKYITIPFISDDSIELNILFDYIPMVRDWLIYEQEWKVFTLPKKLKFKINSYFVDNLFPFDGSLDQVNKYYQKLNTWYKEEFKKHYKDV